MVTVVGDARRSRFGKTDHRHFRVFILEHGWTTMTRTRAWVWAVDAARRDLDFVIARRVPFERSSSNQQPTISRGAYFMRRLKRVLINFIWKSD